MRFAISIVAALLTATFPLRADDSALNEGRYGPQPVGGPHGPESVIRMQSEELQIAFGKEWTEVDAKFVFRNTKAGAPVTQMVGFPDLGLSEIEQRIPLAGELHDMHTFVDGVERTSKLRYGWVKEVDGVYAPVKKRGPDSERVAWYTIEVKFPAGRDVTVERHYRTQNAARVFGWAGRDGKFKQYHVPSFFYYTTATGGDWHGTIGRLQTDVTLKDGWQAKDIAWSGANLPFGQSGDPSMLTSPDRKSWQILSPTHLRFVWEDFEPRTQRDRQGFQIVVKSNLAPYFAIP